MAAKRIRKEIHFFLLIIFFLFSTISFQAAVSSQVADRSNMEETKKEALEELAKVAGRRHSAAAGGNGEWMVRSVRFIMEKMNWKYDFSGGDDGDVKYVEEATMKIVTAVSWIVGDPQLNPYRSVTKGMAGFGKLFNYVWNLDRKKVYGGEKNPVYGCFKAFWSTCEVRGPATLEGAVVHRFECGWEFYDKCQLKMWAQLGQWNVPHIS